VFPAHIAPDQLHAIRHAANQDLAPGSCAFKQQVENMLNRQTEEKTRGATTENTWHRGILEKNVL
jgi:hypothetical protein